MLGGGEPHAVGHPHQLGRLGPGPAADDAVDARVGAGPDVVGARRARRPLPGVAGRIEEPVRARPRRERSDRGGEREAVGRVGAVGGAAMVREAPVVEAAPGEAVAAAAAGGALPLRLGGQAPPERRAVRGGLLRRDARHRHLGRGEPLVLVGDPARSAAPGADAAPVGRVGDLGAIDAVGVRPLDPLRRLRHEPTRRTGPIEIRRERVHRQRPLLDAELDRVGDLRVARAHHEAALREPHDRGRLDAQVAHLPELRPHAARREAPEGERDPEPVHVRRV